MLTAGDIFAGPILRRASPERVAIWIATTKEVLLDGMLRKAGSADWIGEAGTVDRLKVFDNLYVHLVQVVPKEGTFPSGALLEYSIGTIESDGKADHSWFESLALADGLAYPGFTLPSLYLQASGAKLNVLYASCRKPHDIDGGDNDALTYGDSLVFNNAKTLATRPTILCLTGDQIYADDVHDATFDALTTIAKTLEGSAPEKMPNGQTLPGKGQRLKWTKDQAGFTSGEAANHIVTFAEYVASYGLAWNQRNWTTGAIAKEVVTYRDGLKAVRRLMANTPTYMIFDDHDVTDDWNFSIDWIEKVKKSTVGARIVANALSAFWLFQGWGNDPKRYAGVVQQIRDGLAERLSKPEILTTAVGSISTADNWEFQTPTIPSIYFLDTRTNRGHLLGFQRMDGGPPAFLKTPGSWLGTLTRLRSIVSMQGRGVPLVLVAPAPVFGYESIDRMQAAVSGKVVPTTYFDLEGWAANQPHLFLFLTLCADYDVVLLSGDVHYAFTSTATFSVFDGDFIRGAIAKLPTMRLPKTGSGPTATFEFLYASRYLQLNSSGARNSVGGMFKNAAMTGMSMAQGESGYLLVGPTMDPRPGRFKYGKLYRWIKILVSGVWDEARASDVKPNFVYQQRINDALNTGFTTPHNLGYASFLGRKVENGFLVDGKLTATKSWDFASGGPWIPSAP
jgi:hypothetical protein